MRSLSLLSAALTGSFLSLLGAWADGKTSEGESKGEEESGKQFRRSNPNLLKHAVCDDKSIPEHGIQEGLTPRLIMEKCHKLLVMDTAYDYNDPEIHWCSQTVSDWADYGLSGKDICFEDFCNHQLCLMSLIFYGLYFFKPYEVNSDMSLCTQSQLPYVASTHLIHEMAERMKAKLDIRNGLVTGEEEIAAHKKTPLTGPQAMEIMDQFYMPEDEWVLSRGEIRDMLDSRKGSCQSLRHRELRERLTKYASRFQLSGNTGGGGGEDAVEASINRTKRVLDQSGKPGEAPGRTEYVNKHWEWIDVKGTNANPDIDLKYRRPKRSLRGPEGRNNLKVGVILGVANAEEVVRKYQPFLSLWKCYADYHDLEFLMPTDDFNLRAHFRAANWFRWYMADQFLEQYDWLILVDPDQYIVPECWGPERFSFIEDILLQTEKHVVMRDIFPPQTLNNGVTMIRNSAQGRAFLDLLLEKISWIQTFQHDQGAFDETVLEVVGVIEKAGQNPEALLAQAEARRLAIEGSTPEAAFKGGDFRSLDTEMYDSICMPWLFPDINGAHQIAAYSMCWWQNLKEFAGPSGNRSSEVVEFINPKWADINHVVGWRRLENPALLYHFAGPGKSFDDIIENFGLERHIMGDCRRVHDYVEKKMAEKECVAGNKAVGDIHSHCPPPLVVC